ncbi:hypothetical protein GCM10022267_90050 [Lentzea roselyniae]|uniref:YbaB/EbfC DNA-binding family protein n=1 Tax=Lentzea roselyniae TaxID=531940 RepID=A0ABP7CJ66_9PSEU
MTPGEWLADFEATTAELQRNAATFRRNPEMAAQTVTSEDKMLTVTVAPNGPCSISRSHRTRSSPRGSWRWCGG